MESCLICDDHALVREALCGMVARRWPAARILEAADFPEAWALAEQGAAFCLIDLDMPGADPVSGVARLQSLAPAMPLLVVTGSHDDRLLLDLIAQGVAGFAPKQSTSAVLLAAMELVLAGGRYLPPRLADLQSPIPPAALALRGEPLLSARQLEVLRLLAEGQSNKDIARALAVSPATIKTHVAQIIGVLGAANRTEASMRARSLGLI